MINIVVWFSERFPSTDSTKDIAELAMVIKVCRCIITQTLFILVSSYSSNFIV